MRYIKYIRTGTVSAVDTQKSATLLLELEVKMTFLKHMMWAGCNVRHIECAQVPNGPACHWGTYVHPFGLNPE